VVVMYTLHTTHTHTKTYPTYKMSTSDLIISLKAMEQTHGRDEFRAAVSEMLGVALGRPAKKSETETTAAKGEHLKEWRDLVASVRQEMIASSWVHPTTGKTATYRDAMSEASQRRLADASPEELAKRAAAKAKKAAVSEAAAEAVSEGSVKKAGRPKMTDEQKAAAKAKRAAAKAAEAAEPVSEPEAVSDGSARKAGRPKMSPEQKEAAKAKRDAAKAAEAAAAEPVSEPEAVSEGSVKKAGRPKMAAASDDAAASSDASQPRKAGRPKMTDEQKAAAKAKRDAAKAAEAAAAEPVSDSSATKKKAPAKPAPVSDSSVTKKTAPAKPVAKTVAKPEPVSDDAAVSSDGSQAKKGRPKMSPEQKAAAKAKRDAAKAAVAEPETIDATPIEINGKDCVMIMGGYVYEYANDEIGSYLGFMGADGDLDKTKPAPRDV